MYLAGITGYFGSSAINDYISYSNPRNYHGYFFPRLESNKHLLQYIEKRLITLKSLMPNTSNTSWLDFRSHLASFYDKAIHNRTFLQHFFGDHTPSQLLVVLVAELAAHRRMLNNTNFKCWPCIQSNNSCNECSPLHNKAKELELELQKIQSYIEALPEFREEHHMYYQENMQRIGTKAIIALMSLLITRFFCELPGFIPTSIQSYRYKNV